MRKFLLVLCMAGVLSLGVASAALAQTGEVPAEGNEDNGDKTGLFGLLGLADWRGWPSVPTIGTGTFAKAVTGIPGEAKV